MPAATLYSSTGLKEGVIDRLERPLLRLFGFAAKWLTEPTLENTNKQNCHTLVGIKDKLLKKWFADEAHDTNRAKAIRAMFNFIISKYDRDNANGGYLDDFIAEAKACDWIFREETTDTDLVSALDNRQFDKVFDMIE